MGDYYFKADYDDDQYHYDHNYHSSRKPTATGQTLGVIDGKAYGASNVFVIRSTTASAGNGNYYNNYQVAAAVNSRPSCVRKSSKRSWIDHRQLKRRKRIAKYKLYAYEGKVKNSFKNGIRWIKRTCHKIVHGF